MHQTRCDGTDIIVESRWPLVRDEQGQPKSIFVINTDTTEKKRMESQFLRAQRITPRDWRMALVFADISIHWREIRAALSGAPAKPPVAKAPVAKSSRVPRQLEKIVPEDAVAQTR